MATIECTFEEFKRMSKEFIEELETMNAEELENAWKCLGLGYLGMNEEMWRTSAVVLLNMCARFKLSAELKLDVNTVSST